MHPDLIKAQATTLSDWALQWEQAARVDIEGAGEVAYQMTRLSRLMKAVAQNEPVPEDIPRMLPPVHDNDGLREG